MAEDIRGFKAAWSMALAAALATGTAAGAAVIITDPGSRTLRNNGATDYAGTLGYEFKVGPGEVKVIQLGVYDAPGNQADPNDGKVGDGLEQSAVVGLYRVSDKKLIADATIPAGEEGTLLDGFRYVALEESVTLDADGVYRLVMGVDRGGNGFRNYQGGAVAPKTSEHFRISPSVYHNTRGRHNRLEYPNDERVGSAYIGPNFQYEGGVAYPADAPSASTEAPGDRLSTLDKFPGTVVVSESFEEVQGSLPEGWQKRPGPGREDAIGIDAPGAGNAGKSLKITRDHPLAHLSEFGSLSFALPEPADRVAIEFDAKWHWMNPNTTTFGVFTLAEGGAEPSQLRVNIRRNRILQYGGIVNNWITIPSQEKESGERDVVSPWYRMRFVIDRASDGVDVWVSEPDKPDLPEKPVATVPAYGLNQAIASINFEVAGMGWGNECWIDNVVIRTGGEIPAPGKPVGNLDLSDTYTLWTGGEFPRTFDEIGYPEGMTHHIISPRHASWKWFHGTSIEFHKGKLHASWAANDKSENQPGEVVLVSESSDSGKTWSEAKVLAPGDGKGGTEYSNSHGTLLSHDGKLWGFFQKWAGGWDNPLSTEAFILNEDTNEWESQSVVATQGWPLDRPKKTADGNWVMGVSGFKMRKPAIMISQGDNLLQWETFAIPTPREQMFPETSLIVDGNDVVSITRWGDHMAWVSSSSDGGRTFPQARRSNLPMISSKPDSGVLSTGQWFAVVNMEDRDALMIAVGKPGEKGLSKVYKVRYGAPPDADRAYGNPRRLAQSYAYPYSFEHEGNLYVTYSVDKADCELAIIPISSLKAD